jgi:hypothetical protein
MTDEQLEQRLRAWYRLEIPENETAPIALRSALAAIPIASPSAWRGRASRRSVRMLAVAAVLTTLVGGALVGSGTLRLPTDVPPSQPAVVLPIDASPRIPPATARPSVPVATPSATPTSSPGPCATDTLKVLTGDAVEKRVSLLPADLPIGRGAYFTLTPIPRVPRLWAIPPGGGQAALVASISPWLDLIDVLDLSNDGSRALIRAGNISPSGGSPECADIYLVQTDGSGATRLTTFGAGQFVTGGAFSPDGRRVAFTWWDPGTITVLDLASGQMVHQACGLNYGSSPDRIDWSPTSARVAVVCNGVFTTFDAAGAAAPVDYWRGDETLGFLWTDDHTVLVAEEPTGLGLYGTHIDSFDVVSNTVTVVGRFNDASSIEGMAGTFRLSPDGRWLFFLGGLLTAVPADQVNFVGYLASTTGGKPTQILPEDEAASFQGWSADGRALVFIDSDGTLTRVDIETRHRSGIGTVGEGYSQGVWRIP